MLYHPPVWGGHRYTTGGHSISQYSCILTYDEMWVVVSGMCLCIWDTMVRVFLWYRCLIFLFSPSCLFKYFFYARQITSTTVGSPVGVDEEMEEVEQGEEDSIFNVWMLNFFWHIWHVYQGLLSTLKGWYYYQNLVFWSGFCMYHW